MNAAPMLWLESALGWVAHASWQAAILGLIVLGVSRIPRSYLPAGWRSGLWLVVFARLALPVAPPAPISPWRLAAPPTLDRPPSAVEAGQTAVPSDPSPPAPVVPPTLPRADAPAPVLSSGQTGPEAAAALAWPPVRWAALGWVAGVFLLLARLGWLARRLARQRQAWQPVANPGVWSLLQECRAELGVRRPISLVTAPNPVGPATCGVFRACIVLPEGFITRLARDELRLVLLHELMHVRRWDVLVDRAAACLVAVHWFNPMAWLLLRSLRRERELVCDAAVVDHLGAAGAGSYGRVLLKVVEQLRPVAPGPGAVGVFGQDASLTRRIRMIADYRKPTVFGTILGGILVLLMAVLGLTDAAEAPGAAETNSDGQAAAAAPRAEDGTPVPAATLTIAGRCADEDGRPLKGIKVELYRVDYTQRKLERTRQGTSDADGRFRFGELPPLPRDDERAGWFYSLVVAEKGRASTIYWVRNGKSAEDIKIQMPPGATLRGRVTGPNGKPVAGAVVWVQGLLSDPLEGVMSARTDRDGRYEIPDLRAWDAAKVKPTDNGNGTFSVVSECFFWVRHPDYAEERPGYRRIPDTIDVRLQAAGIIEGRVLDQVTGRPAVGVVVQMQPTNENRGGGGGQAHTDPNGNYRLSSVRAGSYNLWAEAPDRTCTALDSFRVAAGKTQRAPDLHLTEGGWLEGRLVDAETHVAVSRDPRSGKRLDVALYGPSRPRSGAACQASRVDDQGNFRLRVAPGLNFPYIMYPDVWDRTQRREFYEKGIEVKSGEIVRLEFRILPKKPLPDPDPSPVRLTIPVPAEREAAAKIRQLGGWYEVDKDHHVIEVNMVYHETPAGRRYDNPLNDTDATLRAVGGFPRLQRLLLQKGQASDDALQSVARLEDLEVLVIWDAQRITDDGMKHLAGLNKLRHLHVSHGGIGDGALAVFGRLPRLEVLSLQGNSFSDDGLRALAGLRHLKSLWIGMNRRPITDAGIQHLAGLTTLEELDLQGSQISDQGVSALKNLKQLHSLYLSGGRNDGKDSFTDAGVESLLALGKLQHLYLNNAAISEQGVRRLAALPDLKELSLSTRSVPEGLRTELKKQRPDLKIQLSGPPRD